MSETESAVFTVLIKAPIETVWRELTRTNAVLPFFFNARLETRGLQPGNRICMRTSNGKYTGVVGEVLAFEPPRRYSHTFRFTQLADAACRVTYELRPVAGGTEFTLTAEDIPAGTQSAKYMKQGGDFIVATLRAVAEQRPLPIKSRLILFMCWIMEPLTPKVARSEHWPLDPRPLSES